ncbi:MAG: hypothetical protein HYV26_06725 [Candidatus Hydrogenedentes bacterium]|nr:hypothetical protein [Candidatus Hydrogenedentota bacterium]
MGRVEYFGKPVASMPSVLLTVKFLLRQNLSGGLAHQSSYLKFFRSLTVFSVRSVV